VRPKVLILLLFAFTASASARAGEVEVRPAPAFVERLDADTRVNPARENVRWGIYDILNDHQISVAEETNYFRTVRKVLSPSGVQNASELSLDFDPSFEQLIVHDVTIIRGDKRVNALAADEIRVIEKEDDSDDRIYDGERTALLFLKDVRPGDVIDYSWSLEGANPILGGRYTDEYDLSSGVPAARIRHRLLWPAGATLQWRGAAPKVEGGAYVWEARDVPALDVEDGIPTWFEPWRSVQVTEFASWADVAQWSNAMFVLDARSQKEVHALAETIRAQHATRESQLTAAIRFVQDDIRYLGIEMGRNSHEPHQPWETLEARWGDCKDKTLLLVALLRELGVEAYPALVNTRLQHRLAEKLPSPFLFDHVIAQVIENGQTYWVDGTISDQGGTLPTIDTPSDGSALVVRAETTALTKIVATSHASVVVEQSYTSRDYAQPTQLEVRTTYTGWNADEMRASLATMSLDDYADERINDLAIDQPRIEADGAPVIRDDRMRNVLVVTERYRIRDLWKDGHWSWYPRVLEQHLTRPDTMIRRMPLAFPHPLNVQQTVTFHLAEDVDVDDFSSVTETPAFRYEYRVDSSGQSVVVRQSLRSRRGDIAAADVPEHLTKLNAIWSEIGYRLSPPGAQPVQRASTSGATWGLGIFAVAMFVTMCVLLASRKSPAPVVETPFVGFAPGEAPVSALAVARPDEIDAHLARRPCACGGTTYVNAEQQRARYAERDLTIVTRSCGTCGREQAVYFTAA
jgi:transglutaminase-like putative cysteine protease